MFAGRLPIRVILKLAACAVSDDVARDDCLVWQLSSDGNFSVALAYRLSNGCDEEQNLDSPMFKKIWGLNVQE